MTISVINKSDNELPKFETTKSAGVDLRASFKYVSPQNPIKLFGDGEIIFKGEGHSKVLLRLDPMSRCIIPTDLYISLPAGYELELRPRSGMAIKKGLTLINTPGTIDEDYRGNIGLPVINLGLEPIWIEDGERICQALLKKYNQFDWNEVDELDGTERGSGAYGHTGSH